MKINYFRWKDMSAAEKDKIFNRNQTDLGKFIEAVKPIIEDVRARGDAALVEYEQKFNGVKLDAAAIKVSAEEIAAAENQVDNETKAAIDICAANVKKHNEAALKSYSGFETEIVPGVITGERLNAIDSAGLYIPGAKNTFPSTVFMLGVPAHVAGVRHVSMITQAREDGSINPVTLYAAKVSGVKNIYKISGAHGIAALAFGTDTVTPVGKILGPGGMYALAAKLLLPQYRMIDTGFPAGPSESIVLADETADPDNTILDILNEAEHGEDSAGILITHDQKLADYVHDNLPGAINALPEPQKSYCAKVMENYGAVIVTNSLQESISVTNEYAAEHVLVKTKDAENVAAQIHHTGAILIGEMTPNTLANFSLGSNHSLPTAGAAKIFSGASILQFLKSVQTGHVKTKAGYDAVAPAAAKMAEIEGFPAHGDALSKRKI